MDRWTDQCLTKYASLSDMTRTCYACKRDLTLDCFYIGRIGRNAGKVSGCYCKECQRSKRREWIALHGSTMRDRCNALRLSALRRGWQWDLSFDRYLQLCKQPCAYGSGTWPQMRIGIDRIDNSIGYTADNSQPCCSRHNSMKSYFFSHDEMMFIVANVKSAAHCGNANYRKKPS